MSGFSNTPPANEFRNHTSWGRTRSPKNILSQHRAGISALGASKQLGNGESAEYSTENQRFLHVTIDATASAGILTIFGLSYAAATYDVNGVPTFKEFAITKDIHGTAFTLNTAGTSFIIPIVGIDKIRFKVASGADDTVNFYAACSTF